MIHQLFYCEVGVMIHYQVRDVRRFLEKAGIIP